jgi:transcriptional regulator with PAS, ATPase and Fis domain/CHASE2 domain-containing sensor protein
MKTTRLAYAISGVILSITAVALLFLLESVDDQLLGTRYDLRGSIPADTGIVIVYLDNEDIQLLGGWPLQRSYYALMIDRLSDWGARVIGFDILLDLPSSASPEYDTLLVSVIERARPVVMSAYGRQLHSEDDDGAPLPERLSYPAPVSVPQSDHELVAPFHLIAERVAGIGHSNIHGRWGDRLPAYVSFDGRVLPFFGFEILRSYYDADRAAGVVLRKNKIKLQRTDGSWRTYSLDGDARLRLNHVGPVSSFRTLRFPQLLRDTPEAVRQREMLRGKIVLIGIIAEGRSSFVPTPYADMLPSVAYHATVIDNLLHNRFLRYPALWLNIVLTLMLTLSGVVIARVLPGIRGLLSVAAVAVLYGALALYFFNQYAVVLPLIAPIVGPLTGAVVMFVLYLQFFQRKLDTLEQEKRSVLEQLQEREDRLQELHTELLNARQNENIEKEQHLLDQVRRYEIEIRELKKMADDTEIDAPADAGSVLRYEEILYSGQGPMKRLMDLLEKVAGTEAPVLLLGESGTGKELAARAIHRRSARKDKPFIAVNCGALTETLLESELFGHERGAFTGAVSAKPGRFERAEGGTIFLDEIAETSEAFQVKLLRVLQEGTFERVGGTEVKKADVRVIAATNKDIDEALKEKSFRLDLYYRLNVFTITMPPLRKRTGDLPHLVAEFLKSHSPDLKVSRLALQALQNYEWPGNVRELQAVIQRTALLTLGEDRYVIRLHDLPPALTDRIGNDIDIADQILEEIRLRKFSRSAVSQTAKELGNLNRGTVAEYLRGYSIQTFVNENYDIDRAARRIAGMDEAAVVENARKKLCEYLQNITGQIDRSRLFEDLEPELQGKYKNLPQRYHPALKEVIESYHAEKWDLTVLK